MEHDIEKYKELVQLLHKTDYVKRNDAKHYSLKEIAFLIQKLDPNGEVIRRHKEIQSGVSIRRAMIVILEETLIECQRNNYNGLEFSKIAKKAKIRFHIRNRSHENRKTLEDVHPIHPCINPNFNEHSKRQYSKALGILTSYYYLYHLSTQTKNSLSAKQIKVEECRF